MNNYYTISITNITSIVNISDNKMFQDFLSISMLSPSVKIVELLNKFPAYLSFLFYILIIYK